MANRSYVYTADAIPWKGQPDPKPIRSLGEWGWEMPLAHKILASESTVRCRSVIWPERETGIAARFAPGRDRLLAFLDVVAKSSPPAPTELEAALAETRAALADPKHAGTYTLLEGSEIYSLANPDVEASAESFAQRFIPNVRAKVDAAIDGKKSKWLEGIVSDWQNKLGLFWSDVLYFDFAGR